MRRKRERSTVLLTGAILFASVGTPAAAGPCADPDTVRGPLRALEAERAEAWLATYEGPAGGLDTPRNLGYPTDTLALSPDGTTAFVTGAGCSRDQ